MLIAAGVFLFLVVPPRPARLDTSGWAELSARTVSGAYHIHTTRSDGIGDKAAVAAAAGRAGLKFVILTDHGDGTRPPDPPAYLEGVLVLDGVEISTDEGHYVALDMPRAPYPLGGAAEAVVEDVTRLGGFGIAAHPDSPKAALRWTNDSAPVDGIEWLNADSEWRSASRRQQVRAGLAYFLRPGPALATLLDRPAALDRWDRRAAVRPVVALAGADAHGGIGQRAEDTSRSLSGMIGIPSYEASFRAFSNRVILDRPLAGNPVDDARAVLGAIRKGSVFTAIDALAGPALLDFRVESGLTQAGMGGAFPGDSDATLTARALLPRGAELVLRHSGQEIGRTTNGELRRSLNDAQGVYRVEVSLPDAPGVPPVPWIVSNPIYVGLSSAAPGASLARPAPAPSGGIAPFPWRIEKDASSGGILRTSDHQVSLEYKLGEGPRNSQFVALATDLRLPSFGALDLSLAGDRPLRVSVQVRRADGGRWGRSFYVDPAGTSLRIPLSTLRPIGGAALAAVSPTDVTSILLVVDLANATPGGSGTLRVLASALVR